MKAKTSKSMVVRQDFYITFTGFIFAGLTVIFTLSFLFDWRITIGEWTLSNQFVPFASIVCFVMTYSSLRMMK